MLEFITETVSIWDELARTDRPIVLYGMGNCADKILDLCAERGISVKAVFASDEFVRGHSFRGYPVQTLAQVEEQYEDFIVLLAFAVDYDSMINRIYEINERHEVRAPDLPVAGGGLFTYEYLMDHAEEFQRTWEMLADERSRQIYADVLNFKISGKLSYIKSATTDKEDDYRDILCLGDQEDYLDIGAYDGDTILEFLDHVQDYHSITAMEPDAKNFRKLTAMVENRGLERITCLNVGSYSRRDTLSFTGKAGRNSALSETGKHTVQVDAVDNLLEGRPVSFIKMDVEGAEEQTLLGCAQSIRRWKPKLNVSAYHRIDDLVRLPRLLQELNPDYRFYLRRHKYIPMWEIILYAL